MRVTLKSTHNKHPCAVLCGAICVCVCVDGVGGTMALLALRHSGTLHCLAEMRDASASIVDAAAHLTSTHTSS